MSSSRPPSHRHSSSFRLGSLAAFAGKLVGANGNSSSNASNAASTTSTASTATTPPVPEPKSTPSPAASSTTAPSAWSRSSSFSSLRRTSSSSLTPDPQVHPPTTPTTPTANPIPPIPPIPPLPTTTNSKGQPLSRTISEPQSPRNGSSSKQSSFGRSTLSTMMGNFSSLSLSRDKHDKEGRRGRSASQTRPSTADSAAVPDRNANARTRSSSPFFRRRSSNNHSSHHSSRRSRDPSPSVEALPYSDWESDTDSLASSKRAPRNSAFSIADDSASEAGDDDETDVQSESSWSSNEIQDKFDEMTELNTERNAQTVAPEAPGLDEPDMDPLGEGVNVIVPPEPLFPTTLHGGHGARRSMTMASRRKNTARLVEHLPLDTSRPIFQRNRCTIRLVNGDPVKVLEESGRKARRYVVASDLSMESKYAVEWSVGTVMRDGDEMIVVTVAEGEGKLDPPEGQAVDRVAKLRNQQERQTLAYLLVRQVTSLLQRTRLNVTVLCQAWHSKASRHHLLDLIDYIGPTMVIVGSRGLGKIKGILLGSTSHYLIQKSSVPVMVARRRLKRPPRKSAHLTSHRARVPLSEAAIDKAPSKVENDVEAMRDEILDRREDVEEVEREDDEVDPEAEGGRGMREGVIGGAVSPTG